MADEIAVSKDDESQAQALEKALNAGRAESFDLCAAWNTVKPFWPWIIRAVKLIPKIGAIIAKALEFLGDALDKYCKK